MNTSISKLKAGPNSPRCAVVSKIQAGPSNPHHATYKKNYQHIHKSLCKHLSSRSLNIKAKDIYQDAGITSPTFYNHYHNSSEALLGYEQSLKEEIYDLISANVNREIFFTILTEYIRRNRQYFLAMRRRGNHYLLMHILKHYRYTLTSRNISDRNLTAYFGMLIVIINCWLEFDKLDKASAAKCARQLKLVRIVKVD